MRRSQPAAGGGPVVVVVGSINVDFVVRVQVLPRPGETVLGTEFARHDGGKGANQAVAAARLGARVVFVGAVGDDDLGTSALATLRTEDIDARVVIVNGATTGVAQICVDARGQNQIAVAPGANANLDGTRVDRALDGLEPGGGVVLASFEVGDEAVVAAARFAARHGLAIVVNAAPARPLAPDLLALDPIVVVNADEATFLADEATPEAAASKLASVARATVVTLGAEGALLAERGSVTPVAGLAVEAIDTTGAGDAFAGAMVADLAAGAPLLDAVRTAAHAASISVTVAGARDGMPTRAQVEEAARPSSLLQ